MEYKAVFFDMDGTILDTLEDLHIALQHALSCSGYALSTIEQSRAWLGNGALHLIRQALPSGADDKAIDMVLSSFKDYYKDNCRNNTKPYKGIRELLGELKRNGIRVAVISNKIAEYVKELSAEYFPGLVDISIGDCPGVRLKPWPDLLLHTAHELDLSVGECIYVGDSEMDIQAAKNAGMDCVSVCWGFRTKEQLEKAGATVIAADCRELKQMLMG